ncbi:MAG: GNAT family N-acetyltransferase [Steroidobacteraceae bacterium]
MPEPWRLVSRSNILQLFPTGEIPQRSEDTGSFAGRGLARRLTRALWGRQHRRGVGSFLHVSEGNKAARKLYESMGFVVRASLPMCKIERVAAGPAAPP